MKFLIAASLLCLALFGQTQGGSLRGYSYSVPVPHQIYGVPVVSTEVAAEDSRPVVEDIQRISFEKPILPQPEEEYDGPIVVAEFNPHVDSLPFVESVVNFDSLSESQPSTVAPVLTTRNPELPRLHPGLPVLPERPVVPLVVDEPVSEVNNAYLPPVREHSSTPVTENSFPGEIHGTSAQQIEHAVTPNAQAEPGDINGPTVDADVTRANPVPDISEIPSLPEAPVTAGSPEPSNQINEVQQVQEILSVPSAVVPEPSSVLVSPAIVKEVAAAPQIGEIPTLPAAPVFPSVPVDLNEIPTVQVHEVSQFTDSPEASLIPERNSFSVQPSFAYVLPSIPQYAGIQGFSPGAPCDFYGIPQIQGFQSLQGAGITELNSLYGLPSLVNQAPSIPQYADITTYPLVSSLPVGPNEVFGVPSLQAAVNPGSGLESFTPILAKEVQINAIPTLPSAPVTPPPQPSGTYLPPPVQVHESPVVSVAEPEQSQGHDQVLATQEHLAHSLISEIPALPVAPVTPSAPAQEIPSVPIAVSELSASHGQHSAEHLSLLQVSQIPALPAAPVTSSNPVQVYEVPELNADQKQHSAANDHLLLLQVSKIPALPSAPVTPSTPVHVYDVSDSPVIPPSDSGLNAGHSAANEHVSLFQISEIPHLPTAPITPSTPAQISESPVIPESNNIHGQHYAADEHLSLVQISQIPSLPEAPITPSAPVVVYEAPVTPSIPITATPTPTAATVQSPANPQHPVPSSQTAVAETPSVTTAGAPLIANHPVVSHIINFANSILSTTATPAAAPPKPGYEYKKPTQALITPVVGLVNHVQNAVNSAIAAASEQAKAPAATADPTLLQTPNKSGYTYKKPVKGFSTPVPLVLISQAQNSASSHSSSSSNVHVNHQFLFPGLIQAIEQLKPCAPGTSSQSVSENSEKTSTGSFNQVTLINPGFLGLHTVPQNAFPVSSY